MTRREYYLRCLREAPGYAWSIYNKSRAILFLILPPIALQALKLCIPEWGWWYVDNLSWIIVLAVLTISFVIGPFLASYSIHEEQEKEIGDLEQKLIPRETLSKQCDELAQIIDEGQVIRQQYRHPDRNPTREPSPRKETEDWLRKCEDYIGTLGPRYLTKWRNEEGLTPLGDNDQRGNDKKERKLYQTLVFRLARSQEILDRLTKSLE